MKAKELWELFTLWFLKPTGIRCSSIYKLYSLSIYKLYRSMWKGPEMNR